MSDKVLFVALFCFLLSCGRLTELRQEVATVNDNLPAAYAPGLIAESVSLDDTVVQFTVLVDDALYQNVDWQDTLYHLSLYELLLRSWDSRMNPEFKARLAKSGCSVRYHVHFRQQDLTLDFDIPNDALD